MNRCFALAVLVASQGCSQTMISGTATTMGEIERKVRLPKQARPLAAYARYYAPRSDGKVVGIYVLTVADLSRASDEGCAEMDSNFELKDVPCPPEPSKTPSIAAGQRRWMSDVRDLPAIDDGGCSVITVIFDQRTRKVEEAACNGVA